MPLLDDLSAAIASAAAAASPGVVGIGARIRGSGVVVGDDRVLTNAHNIRGDEVTVTFGDGRALRGRVVATDVDGDLAVIDVATEGAPAIAWADGAIALGSVVFGLAATSGGAARVTVGTVSAVNRAFRGPGGRRISGSLEHTAPMAPGSSGGPIVDAAGRLVGLNTHRLGEGFYLARQADADLRERVAVLSRGDSVERPRLGVAVAPGHVARRLRRSVGLPDRDGLLVRGVEDGSPADGAGIREGDLIVSVGGTPVADGDALLDAMAGATRSVAVGVVRGADELTLTADLGGGAG
ncbi:MAG: trypsin-like peptidase domain-containing protein [Chloroflexi bacterium]|nr:trypsin-like peptidase domain-containing protein [Chloroflexota bacterium]